MSGGETVEVVKSDDRPARGYSWRPFEHGHTLSLKHGADSERFVGPLATEFVGDALELAPWLAESAYRPAVEAWARAEARALLVHRWLEEHGQLDDNGEPRAAATYALRLEAAAERQRSRLGLDPVSRAKLEQAKAATAVDMATLMAKARAAMAEGDASGITEGEGA